VHRLFGLVLTLSLFVPLARGQADPAPRKERDGPAQDRSDRPTPISRAERLRLRGMPTTPVILITFPAIQEELKLTTAQAAQIKAVKAEFDRRRQEFAQGLTKLQGRLAPAALTEWITSVRIEQEAAIARILHPRQRTRLEQIALQIEGPVCVARPEIAERINLGPEQLEMIQAIVAQMRGAQEQQWAARLRAIRAAGPAAAARPKTGESRNQIATQPAPDPAELAQQEQVQIEDEGVRQIAQVLTRGQRGALNRLMGKPFDLTRLRPGLAQPPRVPATDAPEVLEPVPGPAGAPPSSASGQAPPGGRPATKTGTF
jgi:hypothetical protein